MPSDLQYLTDENIDEIGRPMQPLCVAILGYYLAEYGLVCRRQEER